jgi:threonine synthase
MGRIMYRDTNGTSPAVTRRKAILESQPPSGGLYVPTEIPRFAPGEIESLMGASMPEVGYAVMSKFLRDEIPDDYIRNMCEEALNFPIPLERVYGNTFTERQGYGPTGAFKDTAARLLARESSYYIQWGDSSESWLLAATSGDTGAAIRGGFLGVPGINVIIAYPKNRVTPVQAALMDRYGENVIALACDGVFNDLQNVFMKAFADPDLKKYRLWSANSIGIGRAQPQAIHAILPLTDEAVMESGKTPYYVVQGGNLGHSYAFLLAREMGAFETPVYIAHNTNNVLDRFLKTGVYDVVDTKPTLSNAMDVNDPSNARRIVDMFGGRLIKDKKRLTKSGTEEMVCRIDNMPNMKSMRDAVHSGYVTDDETRETIKELYDEYGAVFEPHGAVGMTCSKRARTFLGPDEIMVCMATAHEAKFPWILNEFGIPYKIPEYMEGILEKPSFAIPFSNRYEDFKEFMLSGEAERVIRKQKETGRPA